MVIFIIKIFLGNLDKYKNRDKIKYHEIVNAGYMPYIIVDFGKYNFSKVKLELERFKIFINIISSL